jgi:hypothetical protein
MKRAGYLTCLLLVSSLLVSSGALRAEDDAGESWDPGPNVKLTLKIVDSEPGAGPDERVHTLVARDRGGVAKLLMGWRVPIPTRRVADDGDPATAYVYQNVGFTAKLEVVILDGGKILVFGQIEASGARQGPEAFREVTGSGMPIIGTFQQDLSVTLQEGKSLRVAEVPDPEGGRVFLELQADILD